MRLRFFLRALFFMFLLAVAIAAPPASAQDIFVTPIPNAPFSAVVNVERTRVQGDGSILNLKTIREIGRDSRGRIHNEARELVPASSSEAPRLLGIHLYDPQTRLSAYLDPQRQIFWTQTVNHPPATEPPMLRLASPTRDGAQNEFTKEEDLGIHEIEGSSAHGVRETQTVAAESSGTGKEIVITDEYWYSADLRINLMIKHSDPRTETVTLTVTQITRSEPDPAFFQIPDQYKPAKAEQAANQ